MKASKSNFHGIVSALLTPFDSHDRLNADALTPLITMQYNMGVRGFFVGGSAGEIFLLNAEERLVLYRETAKIVSELFGNQNDKPFLIAHVGDFSTAQACEYAAACKDYGYDAVCSVLPFYFPCTIEQHRAYLKSISDACRLPVFIYYIPMYNNVVLTADQLISLMNEDFICGIKYTHHDYGIFEKLRRTFPDKILFNGLDHTFLCGLVMGADGAVGSHFNVMGDTFCTIEKLFRDGNIREAFQLQQEANNMIEFLNSYGDSKSAMKYILSELKHIPVGECRLPGQKVPDYWKKELVHTYADRF